MRPTSPTDRPLEDVATTELLHQGLTSAEELIRKQIELAKAEFQRDRPREVGAVSVLGATTLCVTCALQMLLLAAVFGLTRWMPAWVAALSMAGVLIVVAAITATVGWTMRAKKPLAKTIQTLKEEGEWIERETK